MANQSNQATVSTGSNAAPSLGKVTDARLFAARHGLGDLRCDSLDVTYHGSTRVSGLLMNSARTPFFF